MTYSFIAERRGSIPPPGLPGFDHINRFWDSMHSIYAAKILPGEYYVTTQNELISTVLGSCISACIRDKQSGIGGMNHFMLPEKTNVKNSTLSQTSDATRYGNYAMEKMINDILKAGARRENLQVKIFGGGKVLANMNTMDIGQKNIAFVRTYIIAEGLALLAEDVGDIFPRKVLYYPKSGKVKIKKLRSIHNETIAERESKYKTEIIQTPVQGDIELF